MFCQHLKPYGLDQHGADLITWQREPAVGTVMPPFLQILGHELATDAGLRGAAWIHRDHLTTSPFRLVRQNGDELSPRRVTDRQGQTMILDHVFDGKIFVAGHIKRLRQVVP
jgi:hypothetical protein